MGYENGKKGSFKKLYIIFYKTVQYILHFVSHFSVQHHDFNKVRFFASVLTIKLLLRTGVLERMT